MKRRFFIIHDQVGGSTLSCLWDGRVSIIVLVFADLMFRYCRFDFSVTLWVGVYRVSI